MVPEFTYFMLPLLEFLSDQKVHSSDDCAEGVSRILNLTPEDKREMVKSGTRTKVVDRTQWSKTYLSWAELVHTVRRGYYVITKEGLALLAKKPDHIDKDFLKEHYPSFTVNSSPKKDQDTPKKESVIATPAQSHSSAVVEGDSYKQILDLFKAANPDHTACILLKVLSSLGYYCDKDSLSINQSSIQGKFFLDSLKLFPAYLYVNLNSKIVSRNDVGQVLELMYNHSCNSALYLATNELAEDALRFSAPSANIVIMNIQHLAKIIIDKEIGFDIVHSKVFNPNYFLK